MHQSPCAEGFKRGTATGDQRLPAAAALMVFASGSLTEQGRTPIAGRIAGAAGMGLLNDRTSDRGGGMLVRNASESQAIVRNRWTRSGIRYARLASTRQSGSATYGAVVGDCAFSRWPEPADPHHRDRDRRRP